MMPILAPGGQRKHWLAVAVPIALTTLACCGGGDRFELTLRARDAVGSREDPQCIYGNRSVRRDESLPSDIRTCVLNFGRTQWRAADDRRAINRPYDLLWFRAQPEHDDVVCGGQPVVQQYVWDPEELPARDESFELTFDGGDSLRLEGATGVWASASSLDYGPKCFEANGRWRGAAGELQGRTGRFTIAYDSVQTVLRLVED
jgi:hypothetical protein